MNCGAPGTSDEQYFVKILQIVEEDDDEDEVDEDEDLERKKITVLHEYKLEMSEYGMCLQYCTIYDCGEEYMKEFLFVGTGFVKPQGNDLNGYGRVLALKPTQQLSFALQDGHRRWRNTHRIIAF